MRSTDFSLAALYAALDAQRQARGMTWQEAVREMGERSGLAPPKPSTGRRAKGGPVPRWSISRSTVVNLRERSAAEGDGVLQMLRWLNRPPEAFVAGSGAVGAAFDLPAVPPHQILRFDTRALHTALDAQRIARRLTWRQVADEIEGIRPASLTRLKHGGRISFPQVMRITRWLGKPTAQFARGFDR